MKVILELLLVLTAMFFAMLAIVAGCIWAGYVEYFYRRKESG